MSFRNDACKVKVLAVFHSLHSHGSYIAVIEKHWNRRGLPRDLSVKSGFSFSKRAFSANPRLWSFQKDRRVKRIIPANILLSTSVHLLSTFIAATSQSTIRSVSHNPMNGAEIILLVLILYIKETLFLLFTFEGFDSWGCTASHPDTLVLLTNFTFFGAWMKSAWHPRKKQVSHL